MHVSLWPISIGLWFPIIFITGLLFNSPFNLFPGVAVGGPSPQAAAASPCSASLSPCFHVPLHDPSLPRPPFTQIIFPASISTIRGAVKGGASSSPINLSWFFCLSLAISFHLCYTSPSNESPSIDYLATAVLNTQNLIAAPASFVIF